MMHLKNLILTLSLCSISVIGLGQPKVKNQPVAKFIAIPSQLAADAIGVNTHLNYFGSVYDTHYEDIIKPRLIELGAMHIRDHFGSKKISNRYVTLAHQYGIKLLLINNDNGADLENTRNEVVRLNSIRQDKPVVDLIEPANERDIGWKNDWVKLCHYMTEFTNTYKAAEETKDIPLVGPSFANTANSALEFSGHCPKVFNGLNFGNLHAYSGLFPESNFAGGWGMSISQAIENYRKLCKDAPLIETECGYKMSGGTNGHPAVSQRTAAKYVPRLILERLKSGVDRVYFYQLINDTEDFGLLDSDGKPRLQFTALKNFISLFKDNGKSLGTSSLSFSLMGDVRNVRQMLFQKSNGNFLLVLWQGINGSDLGEKSNDYGDINHKDINVQLQLLKKAVSIKIYRPSFENPPDGNGTNSIKTLQQVSKIDLNIPDHILVVEIEY